MTKDEALALALEALELSRDDVCECLNQLMPNAGFERYDRRIAAYQEQLITHDAAIASIKEALLCKHGNEPTSCTSNPMDCQCALDATFAAPQGEPAFWLNEQGELAATRGFAERRWAGQKLIPLYTHQAPAQLSDEQWKAIEGVVFRKLTASMRRAIERHVRGHRETS